VAAPVNSLTQPLDVRTQSWIEFSPRVAMLAALSLPLFGGWALLWDTSPPELRRFRLALTMVFMIIPRGVRLLSNNIS